MAAPRDYARLRFDWYRHPVLEACAAEQPATITLWPILIAMAKERSHATDNPTGAIEAAPVVLARYAWQPVEAVEHALRLLVDGGLIHSAPTDTPNVLRIELDGFERWQVARWSQAEKQQRRRDASRGNALQRTPRVPPSYTETETETKTETGKVKPSLSARADVQRVFDYWVRVERETGGMQQPAFTDGRRRKIQARLADGYTVQQLQKAIAFYARDPHHSGENDRSKRYTDLVTTLKSAEKVEAGIHGWDVKHGSAPAGEARRDELAGMGY